MISDADNGVRIEVEELFEALGRQVVCVEQLELLPCGVNLGQTPTLGWPLHCITTTKLALN